MTQHIAGIARSAMLVNLNISIYSGRKQDKRTQDEVTTSKGSNSKKAASVYKNLFAECKELDDITKFQARVRAEHYRLTMPWDDTGTRLLPTKALLDYKTAMNRYGAEFDRLVEAFLDKYDVLVAAAAFQLGTLFDRGEYLLRDQVAKRFSMDTAMMPMPVSGDFRLDIESEVQRDLVKQFDERMERQLAAANQDAWTRLHEVLTRMSTRLATDEEGKRQIFRDTTVTNAEELCELLTKLNVTNDPALEKARYQLETALQGVTPKGLRESDGERVLVKQKVDSILSAFDWGSDD
jgi:hypothetical protein